MKRETNQINLGNYLTDYLKDQRKAETSRENVTRRLNRASNGSVINAINGYARFKLCITFRNRPNKWVWLPSLDLYKGQNDVYFRDEWTGYRKLVERIEKKYYGKFVMAYIVMTTDVKPIWKNNNYNYCIYSNYKDQKKTRFKGAALNNVSFKEIKNAAGIEYIVNLEEFIITNKLGTYLNKT